MQLQTIIISYLIIIAIIIALICLYVKVYNNRLKNKQSESFSNESSARVRYSMTELEEEYHKRALLLEDEVILIGDISMPYELMMSLTPKDPVYIKYYDTYRPMIVLMYKHELGYVLIPRDEEGDPKFYPFYKVFIGVPRIDFVTGFIRSKEGEDDVFIVNGLVERLKNMPYPDDNTADDYEPDFGDSEEYAAQQREKKSDYEGLQAYDISKEE